MTGGTKTGKKKSDAAFYYALAIEDGSTPEESLDRIDAFLGPEHRSLQEGTLKANKTRREKEIDYRTEGVKQMESGNWVSLYTQYFY